MSPDSIGPYIIGVASSALFDTHHEHELFERKGLRPFIDHQIAHEDIPFARGTAFPLVEALLKLNELCRVKRSGKRLVDVVVVSKSHSAAALRSIKSAKHHGLDITLAAFTAGLPVADFVKAHGVLLFLSKNAHDVTEVINHGIGAGLMCDPPKACVLPQQLVIGFDGDSVLFSDEADRVYADKGLPEFLLHEDVNGNHPLPPGPIQPFLKMIGDLQRYFRTEFPESLPPIRTALVTARSASTVERVIKTLRSWNIEIDVMCLQNGYTKADILRALKPHIYFDEQAKNLRPVWDHVPCARVPYGIFAEREDAAIANATQTLQPTPSVIQPAATILKAVDLVARVGAELPAKHTEEVSESVSKLELSSRCRNVFLQYMPLSGTGKRVLSAPYRKFITDASSRSPKDRAKIVREVERFDLSALVDHEAMLNREGDGLLGKLNAILDSFDSSRPIQTDMNLRD